MVCKLFCTHLPSPAVFVKHLFDMSFSIMSFFVTGLLLKIAASMALPRDEWITVQSPLDSNVSLSFKEVRKFSSCSLVPFCSSSSDIPLRNHSWG